MCALYSLGKQGVIFRRDVVLDEATLGANDDEQHIILDNSLFGYGFNNDPPNYYHDAIKSKNQEQ
ncbi:hypothetical protein TWF173_000612 [Orbilia oligospora]|nr:hypothetical protein TWF173_000612 [Orbilia oligospora]